MSTYQTDHQRNLWAQIDAWNAAYPPGTPVLVTTGLESSRTVRSTTIGEAYEENYRALIGIEASTTPVPLSNIQPLQS